MSCLVRRRLSLLKRDDHKEPNEYCLLLYLVLLYSGVHSGFSVVVLVQHKKTCVQFVDGMKEINW